MKKADLYFNIFLVALSVFAFVEALSFPYFARGSLGAGFFPRWISGLLFVLATANTIKIAISIKKDGDSVRFFGDENQGKRVLIFYVTLIPYIVAITYIGLIPATLVYAIGLYKIFDKFTWKATVPPAIGLVVFIYIVFVFALGVRLPRPVWGFFTFLG